MIPPIKQTYRTRPVKFIEVLSCGEWQVKIYSISLNNPVVNEQSLNAAKQMLPVWLEKHNIYELDTYQVATLILHEGKEGCFVIINWWIDENMLQQFVYLETYTAPGIYNLYSDNGIFTCVWEMAVLWFERNAWVEKVLKQPQHPQAIQQYLQTYFNGEV